jgi:hemoglobin
MAGDEREGGDAPCWAHLFDDGEPSDISSRVDLERLVKAFYRDVATDDILGPVFAAARVDWPTHLDKLVDFWAWQLLGERNYGGQPLRAHEPVHARTPFGSEHYERWLELFTSTVDSLFAGPVALEAKRRAVRVASAMRRILEAEPATDTRGPLDPVAVRLSPSPRR